ncbi:hypothetical protein L1887_55154 [Cichorium endivia]|nr:hypothetical protein L1887_55154 [Cichorium endivia]
MCTCVQHPPTLPIDPHPRAVKQAQLGRTHRRAASFSCRPSSNRHYCPSLEAQGQGAKCGNPHVSVGQASNRRETWQLCNAAENLLSDDGEAGMSCDVHSVQLMLKPRRDPGPYHLHQSFPLARE